MTKGKKIAIAAIIIVGGGLIAASSLKGRNTATEVRVEAVSNQDLVSSVTASGQVLPTKKVNLSSEISGKITRLAVKDGDMVKAGQFLLQIDPQQYEANVLRGDASLANARAALAQARSNLLQSKRNAERQEEIRKTNPALVSAQELENLTTQVDVNLAQVEAAEQNVKQAEASLKDAKYQLDRTTIYAPMSGRVTRLVVEVGETAIQGTLNKDAATLLTISDMSVLETKVKVDETDVSRINVGDSAVIQIDAFPDTTFLGRVVEISNSSVYRPATGATDQAIDYEVTVQILNPPKETRPDFSSTAKIVTDTRSKAIAIPIIALTVREDSALANTDKVEAPPTTGAPAATIITKKRDIEGVFVVGEDNKVTFRPVKVGIAGEKYFEVLDGLKVGERIVAGTYQAIRELKDGQLVRETTIAPAATKAAGTP